MYSAASLTDVSCASSRGECSVVFLDTLVLDVLEGAFGDVARLVGNMTLHGGCDRWTPRHPFQEVCQLRFMRTTTPDETSEWNPFA
jgi:hypothetical protein